jgi:hypothetical protein
MKASLSAAALNQCGGSEIRIHYCRGFIMRISEPKPHWNQYLAGVLSIPKFANQVAAQ